LAMPARIGEPRGLSGLIDDIQTPGFATATGLILYGARSEPKPKSGFSLGRFGKRLPKLPVKGAAGKAVDLIKSFLP